MKSSIQAEQYILYMQWQSKLDSNFIRFAAEFKRFNINVIPVKPTELSYFLEKKEVPIIVITSTLDEYQKYQNLSKKYFKFYVKNKKVKLFHLNSFSMDHDFISSSGRHSYFHVPLPIQINEATLLVLSHYFEEMEGRNDWPGGRRAKLPSLDG